MGLDQFRDRVAGQSRDFLCLAGAQVRVRGPAPLAVGRPLRAVFHRSRGAQRAARPRRGGQLRGLGAPRCPGRVEGRLAAGLAYRPRPGRKPDGPHPGRLDGSAPRGSDPARNRGGVLPAQAPGSAGGALHAFPAPGVHRAAGIRERPLAGRARRLWPDAGNLAQRSPLAGYHHRRRRIGHRPADGCRRAAPPRQRLQRRPDPRRGGRHGPLDRPQLAAGPLAGHLAAAAGRLRSGGLSVQAARTRLALLRYRLRPAAALRRHPGARRPDRTGRAGA